MYGAPPLLQATTKQPQRGPPTHEEACPPGRGIPHVCSKQQRNNHMAPPHTHGRYAPPPPKPRYTTLGVSARTCLWTGGGPHSPSDRCQSPHQLTDQTSAVCCCMLVRVCVRVLVDGGDVTHRVAAFSCCMLVCCCVYVWRGAPPVPTPPHQPTDPPSAVWRCA